MKLLRKKVEDTKNAAAEDKLIYAGQFKYSNGYYEEYYSEQRCNR